MTTKEKEPAVEDMFSHPTGISATQWHDHQADMKRRAAEREAKRPELELCLDAKWAAKREAEKPQYRFTVSAEWTGKDKDDMTRFNSEQVVIAQNENDAWAMFCDKIGKYPLRKTAKVSIKRGRQVSVAELVTQSPDEKPELPQKTLGPKARPIRLS